MFAGTRLNAGLSFVLKVNRLMKTACSEEPDDHQPQTQEVVQQNIQQSGADEPVAEELKTLEGKSRKGGEASQQTDEKKEPKARVQIVGFPPSPQKTYEE